MKPSRLLMARLWPQGVWEGAGSRGASTVSQRPVQGQSALVGSEAGTKHISGRTPSGQAGGLGESKGLEDQLFRGWTIFLTP